MKNFVWKNLSIDGQKQALARPPFRDDPALVKNVAAILRDVKTRGDVAVREFSLRFDKISRDEFRISTAAINAAPKKIAPGLRAAIKQAIANVTAFHEQERPKPAKKQTMRGVMCRLEWRAIDTVGLYIPGGTAPLFSTLLMQAVPARIAGCKRVVVCTPPQRDGTIHPAILATAKLCGVSEIYAVGGAQAIAAMAYGTKTIPKADKIFGPGNAYVTVAKQLASQDPDGAAIDMPAGPSEVLVIAEKSARPDWVAADLLAQAEHDVNAQAVLVTTSADFAAQVDAEIQKQLTNLPRRDIAGQSLQNGKIIVAANMATAIDIANRYAPEHLIIHNKDAQRWLSKIRHAGSVFLGAMTPESAGDYASGTNHVLPTYGYARATGGLTVLGFMKSMTVQTITRNGLRRLGPTLIEMAEAEGLDAHAAAVKIRMRMKE